MTEQHDKTWRAMEDTTAGPTVTHRWYVREPGRSANVASHLTRDEAERIVRAVNGERALREALHELLAAPIWGHEHWDKEGTRGLNCPLCQGQSTARQAARAALAASECTNQGEE